jgi:uncharacterized protein (TIGR02996 family)
MTDDFALLLGTVPSLEREEQFGVLRYALIHRLRRSKYARNYILRGSSVLKHWLPNAREPNDLDLVAVYPHDPARCTEEIFSVCKDTSLGSDVWPIEEQNMLPMWEYELFPGIRFHVPWKRGTYSETVQLDVAFDDQPPLPTEMIDWHPIPGQPVLKVQAWTREACLASKLCWIANDSAQSAPDENDLGDAILLAQHGSINAGLLQNLIRAILAVQNKTVSIFESWDQRIREAMQGKRKTEPASRSSRNDWMAESNERHANRRHTQNTLLRDLQYPLAPLLDGMIWFPTSEEWAFLHAIAANPNDKLPALKYADWLEDRVDGRGELLRIHVEHKAGRKLSREEQQRRTELMKQAPVRWCRLLGIPPG